MVNCAFFLSEFLNQSDKEDADGTPAGVLGRTLSFEDEDMSPDPDDDPRDALRVTSFFVSFFATIFVIFLFLLFFEWLERTRV